jgi:hypothetical protein
MHNDTNIFEAPQVGGINIITTTSSISHIEHAKLAFAPSEVIDLTAESLGHEGLARLVHRHVRAHVAALREPFPAQVAGVGSLSLWRRSCVLRLPSWEKDWEQPKYLQVWRMLEG